MVVRLDVRSVVSLVSSIAKQATSQYVECSNISIRGGHIIQSRGCFSTSGCITPEN